MSSQFGPQRLQVLVEGFMDLKKKNEQFLEHDNVQDLRTNMHTIAHKVLSG